MIFHYIPFSAKNCSRQSYFQHMSHIHFVYICILDSSVRLIKQML